MKFKIKKYFKENFMDFVIIFGIWTISSFSAGIINYITGLNVETFFIFGMFFVMAFVYDYFKLDWVKEYKEKKYKEDLWKM